MEVYLKMEKMNGIEIPFTLWSKAMINKNKKRATTRTKKYGNVGDTFTVDGRKFKILYIHKYPLGFIRDYFWKIEGANNPNEFVDAWEAIHNRKGFVENQIVWFHLFEEAKNE